jgi:hypothetical protein
MQIDTIIKYILLLCLLLGLSGCTLKQYSEDKHVLYKKRLDWYLFANGKRDQFNKNEGIDAYDVNYTSVIPYYGAEESDGYGVNRTTFKFIDSISPHYRIRKYRFEMYMLSEINLLEEESQYFYEAQQELQTKSSKTINKFIPYKCYFPYIKHNKAYRLEERCYIKKIDQEAILFTSFIFKQKRKELFENEIIPTMLKSIKLTPTKVSPWKYN